jgi:hypothetical protein
MKLSKENRKEIHETLTSAGIAYYLGSDYKRVLQNAEKRTISPLMKRVYKMTQDIDVNSFENAITVMI